jgi:hypothetical protein
MKEDALNGRAFSNIVAEYTKEIDPEHPLKIIGGQHRFEAIKAALEAGVNNYHGVKVYLDLDMDQRLDVQLISNTNIAISSDLFDRMQETSRGPELRTWCQSVGLLPAGKDFAARGGRGRLLTVRDARTFISNYYLGQQIEMNQFEITDTTPTLCDTGEHDHGWEQLRNKNPVIWKDAALAKAGTEFARLIAAQRSAFAAIKAMNAAIISAWAYIAGVWKDISHLLTLLVEIR